MPIDAAVSVPSIFPLTILFFPDCLRHLPSAISSHVTENHFKLATCDHAPLPTLTSTVSMAFHHEYVFGEVELRALIARGDWRHGSP